MLLRMSELAKRLKIELKDVDKLNFFGSYAANNSDFVFSEKERSLILDLVERVKYAYGQNKNYSSINNEIGSNSQSFYYWFRSVESQPQVPCQNDLKAPVGAQNVLEKY